MDWTNDEMQALTYAENDHPNWYVGVATKAVELVAARAGTMTADVDALIQTISDGSREWDGDAFAALGRLRELADERIALGARVAMLEKERDVSRRLAMDAEADLEKLRERLTAAEEGNRELVRRAQQAEALLEREQESARIWTKRALAAVERAEAAEARCATLSAAGQVPSAHVDKHGMNDVEAALHQLNHGERHPCSTTCTHDDATKPGHPERVKTHSAAVALLGDVERRMNMDGVKERSEAVTISLDSAAHRQVDERGRCRHQERWAQCSLCDEHEAGAEAMRAACWEVVQGQLQACGVYAESPMWKVVKSAIEGAAP